MAQVCLERLSGAGRWLAKTTNPVRLDCPANRLTFTPHTRKTWLRKQVIRLVFAVHLRIRSIQSRQHQKTVEENAKRPSRWAERLLQGVIWLWVVLR